MTKQDIIDSWKEIYSKNKWPFIAIGQIRKALGGTDIKPLVTELYRERKMLVVRGINQALLVYVGDETIYGEIKHLLSFNNNTNGKR